MRINIPKILYFEYSRRICFDRDEMYFLKVPDLKILGRRINIRPKIEAFSYPEGTTQQDFLNYVNSNNFTQPY